jgi:mRNA interferase MazF
MTLLLGEIILIRMVFHQSTGAKVRPAVVLCDTGDDDFIAAPITSVLRQSRYDLVIRDWQVTGLNVASGIRVHKLSVLNKPEIIRRLGQLSASDREQLNELLCLIFCRSNIAGQ